MSMQPIISERSLREYIRKDLGVENPYTGNFPQFYDLLLSSGYVDHEESARQLTRLLGRSRSILEIGVGTGVLTQELIERGHQVTGIDLSEAMLQQARRRIGCHAELKLQDVCELNLDQKFDAAVSEGGVWFFVPRCNRLMLQSHLAGVGKNLQALRKVAQHLKPGGKFAISIHEANADYSMPLESGLFLTEFHRELKRGIESTFSIHTADGVILSHGVQKFATFGGAEQNRLFAAAGFGDARVVSGTDYLLLERH
ncbi:MAG: methyltransferase domain-containing protein [Oligoflexia bacterium]|nr:methyltransferase domain-containing protein [Oligoflexia bacterium]